MFSWSHSKLRHYETCPYRLTLIDAKTPQATSPHAEKGIIIHSSIETYLKSDKGPPYADPPPYPAFEKDLIALHRAGASSELALAVDKHWNPAPWDTAWGRAILDAVVITPSYVRIVDFKSGKAATLPHLDQARTYALFAYAHHPGKEEFTMEFWYLGNGKRQYYSFSPRMLIPIRKHLTARALRAELDTKRLPRPNKFVCGYCPFIDHCRYAPDDKITPAL